MLQFFLCFCVGGFICEVRFVLCFMTAFFFVSSLIFLQLWNRVVFSTSSTIMGYIVHLLLLGKRLHQLGLSFSRSNLNRAELPC